MKILYCVQRYGEEIAGGAEAACRQLAERMVVRGHEVAVLSTCALDYNTWTDHYEAGTSELNGVAVTRVPVRAPRSEPRFTAIHRRVVGEGAPSLAVQRDWLRNLGPDSPRLLEALPEWAGWADVVVFYTYLYAPFGLGARIAGEYAPVVLHPAAHDEPAWWLPVYREALQACDGFSLQTPEEADLLASVGVGYEADELVGMGVDTGATGDADRFRARFALGEEATALYLGRLDPGKGPDELYRYMVQLWDTGRTRAKLVVVGEPVISLPEHPGVLFTGFVDEQTKADALAAATVFVQPSYFESFSLSLCEAWVQRTAALVQRSCAVLAGQVHRSGGGIAYSGLAEFEAALARLLDDRSLRSSLGDAGRAYVEQHYQWPEVLDRYEALLERVVGRAASGHGPGGHPG